MKPYFPLTLPFVAWLGLVWATTACTHTPPVASSAPVAQRQPLQYRVYSLPRSTVHTLVIPARDYTVTVAVAPGVQSIVTFAQQNQAVAVLNGGFFDPVNSKSTSHIVSQGKRVANPQDNERLMQNSDLVPYLPLILNRSELRGYDCAGKSRYDISRRNQPVSPNCELFMALGAGPQLLPENTSIQEGFLAFAGNTAIRDSIGSQHTNARSAIGLKADGTMVWVMVAQKPGSPQPGGVSLPELAQFMQTLGVVKALNLDGGSSASFYYQGQTYSGKVSGNGKPILRPVKSVLLLHEKQ